MKISIESEAYVKDWNNPLQDMLEAKADGYDCLDFQLFCTTDDNDFFTCSEEEFAERMLKIKNCAKDVGISFSQAHGPWKYPTVDATPEGRAERFEKFSRTIKGCGMIGIKYVAFHPLMPFDKWGETEPDPAYANRINYEFYTELCKVAEENGVVICFENMPFKAQYVSKPLPTFEFIKQINSPNFKMCLDTGHAVMLGSNLPEDIRKIGKGTIKILHVHDNDGTADQHLYPGDGVIDWDAFCDALKDVEFDGVFALETHAHPELLSEEELKVQRKRFAKRARELAAKCE